MRPVSVLATVTGRDRPGITAAFFAALAAHDVDVRDVEQVVIRERLILAVLLDLQGDAAAMRNSVTRTARALGLECEVAIADDTRTPRQLGDSRRSHVMVLGHPLRPGALSHVAQYVADLGANIESLTQLANEPAASVEMVVRADDPDALRVALVTAARDTGVDVAVEQPGLSRRAKRLVLLDLDTTLIRHDSLELLAERAGVGTGVVALSDRERAGELSGADALRARVALLAGLPVTEVEAARDGVPFAPGARAFVQTLHRLGYQVGIVSRGFTAFTDRVVDELGLDFAAANQLEIADGRLTGRLVGGVIDRAGKAAALREFADEFGVPLSQTVAVGNGMDDLDMLAVAGLAIAFTAKATPLPGTEAAVDLPYLDTVLFVLGASRDDTDDAVEGR